MSSAVDPYKVVSLRGDLWLVPDIDGGFNGDVVFAPGGIERGRIKADGTYTGFPSSGGGFTINGTQGTGKSPISDGSGTPTWTDVATQSELDAETAARVLADAGLQPLDSDLTAIAALATTSFGRSVLTQADATALRTLAGLGSAATQASSAFDAAGAAAAAQAASQPLDSDLTAIAALTTTTYGRALLTMADAAALRTAAGLGTAATQASTAFDAAGAAAAAQAASQPLDSDLTAIAALTTTSFGRNILAVADPADGTKFLNGLGAFSTPSITATNSYKVFNVEDATYGAVADFFAQDGVAVQGPSSNTTLSAAITTTGATTLTVNSAASYPSSGNYYIVIDSEVMQVTGGQGTTTWTISRGQLGTAAATHLISVPVAPAFTSASAPFVVGDVGKTIVLQRAGPSNEQDRHTTVASFINSQVITLTNNAQRSQAVTRFYISRSGAQTTAIQTAIDAAYTAGGGFVYCPGVGYLVGTLVLKNRVFISGATMMGTMLHQASNTNFPVIRNDYTTDNTAFFTGVMNMHIDGNRGNQSDVATTLSAQYTAGASTCSLTSVAGFLPAGMVTLANGNKLYYTSISGNVLQGVSDGYESSTSATQAIGGSVTQHAAGGIYHSTQPPTSQGATTEAFDPHHLVQNVFIKNVKGDGIQSHGQSENRWHNVWVQYCDEIGFRPSFDSWLSNCTADKTGRHGYYIRSSETKLTNCKAFYAGNVTATEGHGFFIEGPTSAEEGTKVLSSCGAQDCQGAGLFTRNAQRVIAQFTASSNSRVGAGTWAGIHLTSNGAPGTSNCIIDATCVERNANGNNQTAGLFMDATCNANKVRITHGAATGATVGVAIAAASSLVGGNDISVNGMGGMTTPAFASTYTPDPYVSTVHKPGLLTGPITIAAPSNAHFGCPLTLILRQDVTGGRTITWNAAFLNTPTSVTTASGFTIGRFVYDGTNWIGV